MYASDRLVAINCTFTGNTTRDANYGALHAGVGVYLYHSTVADNVGPCIVSKKLRAYNSIITGDFAKAQPKATVKNAIKRLSEKTGNESGGTLMTPLQTGRKSTNSVRINFCKDSRSVRRAKSSRVFQDNLYAEAEEEDQADIDGDSLIEGVFAAVTTASVFGGRTVEEDGTLTPLADGPADKMADALTGEKIEVPGDDDSLVKKVRARKEQGSRKSVRTINVPTAPEIIAALKKDAVGVSRPASGKVCYGAKEIGVGDEDGL